MEDRHKGTPVDAAEQGDIAEGGADCVDAVDTISQRKKEPTKERKIVSFPPLFGFCQAVLWPSVTSL
ncbi:MAG: hypothetical protein UZ07_CHB004002242 [Chlorobi bacterium OLB7]|nr:MAG: hypothetical protein UZ07_CHB004002242 [Chlorobi bacterium OLB7]